MVRTDLELELKARKAAVAGNVVGSVGRGHGGLQSGLQRLRCPVLAAAATTTGGRLVAEALSVCVSGSVETAGATASLCQIEGAR